MATEHDAFDEKPEQLSALGGVRHFEQVPKSWSVFEQPQVPLLQCELGANGLKSCATIGDGIDQPLPDTVSVRDKYVELWDAVKNAPPEP